MQAKSSRAVTWDDLAASYLKQPTLKRGVSDLLHDQYELLSSLLKGNQVLPLKAALDWIVMTLLQTFNWMAVSEKY